MSRRLKSLVIVAMLVAMGSVAIGQESLKEVVEQQGFGWMAGKWKATTEDGQEILLAYQWAVKGHAIVTTFKMGDSSSQGMIYFDADQQQVRQFSVDSRGRATKATWEVQDGKAIARTRMTDEYGESTDVAIAYSKVDATTMKVAVYGLEDGELSEYPWFEVNFKKQKK
ncbi:MAG: hypothetical protein ACYSWQ_07050 [Planctomycetota bacterium]